MITLKKLSLLFITTFVATAASAQHQIVFETGDTLKCEISDASNTYIYFLNDEGAGRKISFSFVSSVFFDENGGTLRLFGMHTPRRWNMRTIA